MTHDEQHARAVEMIEDELRWMRPTREYASAIGSLTLMAFFLGAISLEERHEYKGRAKQIRLGQTVQLVEAS